MIDINRRKKLVALIKRFHKSKFVAIALITILSHTIFINSAVCEVKADITVAVLDLDPAGIPKAISKLLTNRLINELAKSKRFVVMERERRDEIFEQKEITLSGICGNIECLVDVGTMLNTQNIIVGQVGKIGNTYTISARMADVSKGVIIKTANWDHQGAIDELLTKGATSIAHQLIGIMNKDDPNPGDDDDSDGVPSNSGVLSVSTFPSFASVFINNELFGKSPCVLGGLQIGTQYLLAVDHPGYKRDSKVVKIQNTDTTVVNFILSKNKKDSGASGVFLKYLAVAAILSISVALITPSGSN
ncbi:PEGA domain-containing protein [Candidatus Peregrinibacteria bacterium]|nr:PEGA domain-containing protein [Candidatus Peregrinibacteria bacterium]